MDKKPISNQLFFSLSLVEDKNEWETYLKSALDNNISQDWEYGTFRSENKNIGVLRFKISDTTKVFAIFQMYIIKINYLPFFKIAYLNRGPLFLEKINEDNFDKIISLIKRKFSIFSLKVFVFNPFFPINTVYHKYLLNINFFRKFSTKYITSYIDLNNTIDTLRKNLNSKWRNQLTTAEKKNIQIFMDQNGEYDNFIISSYRQMASVKDFKTLTDIQILSLFKKFRKNKKLFVFLAFNEQSQPIAFTITLGFHKKAVYLIGWVAAEARSLNPSNVLIWNTILFLKDNLYNTFDLGGMDPKNLPGITKFKRGIGGEEYVFEEKIISIF